MAPGDLSGQCEPESHATVALARAAHAVERLEDPLALVISTQVPGMPLSVQYGTALVLLLLVLSLTLVATMIRTRMRRRRDW